MAEHGLALRERRGAVDLLYGHDDAVARWVASRLPGDVTFKDYRAIGVALHGELIAGVVYSEYRHPNMELSIAADSPRWCSRRTLRELLGYPFLQIGVTRITATLDEANARSRALVERLGFMLEGRLRECMDTRDALIYGMLRRECKWIGAHNEQRQSEPAPGS